LDLDSFCIGILLRHQECGLPFKMALLTGIKPSTCSAAAVVESVAEKNSLSYTGNDDNILVEILNAQNSRFFSTAMVRS